ncbi:MAG TPA: hypothetical protein VGB73_00790 [Pyrinomonadaceae bacterium]|jgi:chromosome segregation ATPase
MSADRLTEVLNYLSAISRDVGELRTEVRANATKLEELRADVDAKFEELRAEMNAGFEQVRTDIRHLKHKMEIVTQDLMDLRTDGRELRKRMDVLESKGA